MKKLFLILLIIPTLSLASGKLQLKSGWSVETEKFVPQVGLAIYEPVFKSAFYRQWTGVGAQPRLFESHVIYMVSDHAAGVNIGKMSLSMGVKLQRASQELIGINSDAMLYTALEYKLW